MSSSKTDPQFKKIVDLTLKENEKLTAFFKANGVELKYDEVGWIEGKDVVTSAVLIETVAKDQGEDKPKGYYMHDGTTKDATEFTKLVKAAEDRYSILRAYVGIDNTAARELYAQAGFMDTWTEAKMFEEINQMLMSHEG